MLSRTRNGSVALLIALLCALVLLAPASAQRRPVLGQPADGANDPATPAVALPKDRKATQVLAAAEDLIKDQDWRPAIRALQTIIDAREDAFVTVTRPGPDGKPLERVIAARAEANRLLLALPAAGRAAYQKQVGDDAAQRLAQAKQLG